MKRLSVCWLAAAMVVGLTGGITRSEELAPDTTHTIFGIVMELRAGTAEVPVCLCDAATGLPLAKETYNPIEWDKDQVGDLAKKMAIVITDERGRFRFEGVPDGNYRLVAQKWIGSYKGVFEEHGTVIQLMGTVDNVVVPRPTEYYEALVALQPAGRGIVQFDQDVGNNETFMFLSTSPPQFDPILGLYSMGTPFLQHLVGVNRMPLGKTTVIGVPEGPLYAFFIAPDNRPGYATVKVPASKGGLVRVPPEPFVAGWSDGRKTPPPKLAQLMQFMDAHSLSAEKLLNIPKLSSASAEAYRSRMQELYKDLSREIELVDGTTARVGDILAVEGYRRLNE